MLNWWRDIRFGGRMLARNKGFTAVAILALALGIGPNVAIFSVIWATFLAPLPYPHANQLVVVWSHYKGQRIGTRGESYADMAAENHSFQYLDFGEWNALHITNSDHTQEDILGHGITPGYYTKNLGVPMALGRGFLPDEGAPGKDHLVVLTHDLWETRYHADRNILGKPILIYGEPYTVVGVLQAGASDRIPGAEFLVPVLPRPGVHSDLYGDVFGRLKPGVNVAQAQAELSTIYRRVVQRNDPRDAQFASLTVEPLKDDFLNPNLVRNLWLLLAAVGLALLIACADVANLLLARGSARQQELALRFSLGATRRQVFAQLFTESLTLAILGGVIGVGLGWIILKATLAILPPVTAEAVIHVNLPVLCFAAGATLLSGIVFGCAPALHAARVNLSETLKQGSRSISGRGRARIQGTLVTVEFALALTLLAGAALAMHSFWNLSNADLGVTTDHVVTAQFERPAPAGNQAHASAPSPQEIIAGQRQLVQRVRAVPGVEDAALATNIPLEGYGSFPFTVAGQPVDTRHSPVADLEAVTPGFFRTFGVRLVRGRFLSESDTLTSSPAVVVSVSFVRRYLPHSDPLTSSLIITPPVPERGQHGTPVSYQIVGIFHNIHNDQITGTAQPEMIVSLWQAPWPYVELAARTVVAPGAVSSGIRSAVAESSLTLGPVETMRQIVERQLTGQRFGMTLFGGFALIALLLAALGIYGVMSFAVAQRTHEVGIRMALGAQKAQVVALMVRSGMRLAVPGVVIGLAGIYVLGRLMHSTLYGVGMVDYGSAVLVVILLLAVAVLACWIPARRSARVDPMIALRDE